MRRFSPVAKRPVLFFVLVSTVLIAGCAGSSPVEKVDPATENFSHLKDAWANYQAKHSGNPPKTLADLRSEIQSLNVGEPDKILTSPRDSKPYQFVPGVRFDEGAIVESEEGSGEPKKASVLIHEQDGLDGKRWVMFANGTLDLVDETEWQKIKPKKK